MSASNKILQAAAGNAAGESVYVDDVFSTDVWAGNDNVAFDITNDIDLNGEGGMVWIKARNATYDHNIFDTERGANKWVEPNTTLGQQTATNKVNAFNSDGYSLGTNTLVNGGTDKDYVGWTFRKQAGFFDVVTYTGNGSNRTISHNLGSVPGVMIVKRTSASEGWQVYHRDLATDEYLELNVDSAKSNSNGTLRWNSTRPTATELSLGTHDSVNASGSTYVAYLFAHDDQSFGDDSDEAIIKCDSYTGNGSSDGPTVTLGFEPQWLIIKRLAGGTGDWTILDNMRGIHTGSTEDARLFANRNYVESNNATVVDLQATGFKITSSGSQFNNNGDDYAYIAIRRPMKTPEAGTDVFAIDQPDSSSEPKYRASFPVDMAWFRSNITSTQNTSISNRLTGKGTLLTNDTTVEADENAHQWDYMNGWFADSGTETNNRSWMFKRATGFFDVVAYTGNATSDRDINHNLGVTPELMIVKARDSAQNWVTYDSDTGATNYMRLNTSAQPATTSGIWNNTAPTASVFTVDGTGGRAEVNANGTDYIAYLFASVAGVSKIGVYTGTGSNIDVDCGFSAGARFILIKVNSDSGDWYYWDSNRGIVAGNDPYLLLNTTDAQVTNTDYIDPLNAGFTVTSSAPAGLNASGETYIFLAIA